MSSLSQADITLGPASIWIEGYEFPGITDMWYDSNWLLVRVRCPTDIGMLHMISPCLMTSDIDRLASACEAMLEMLTDSIELWPIEPNLHLRIARLRVDDRFCAALTLKPDTPDRSRLAKVVEFELSRSDVAALGESLRRVLLKFPIRAIDKRPG